MVTNSVNCFLIVLVFIVMLLMHSYVKFYKNMLERMMKDDLALKGDIDGAEILIFPSNQLPEKSQCKNILLFIILLIVV